MNTGGLGGLGGMYNIDFTQNNSRRPNGPSLLEKILMGDEGGGYDRAYGQAKDVQDYAAIAKLLAMNNQIGRGERMQNQSPAPVMNINRYIQSLLGG